MPINEPSQLHPPTVTPAHLADEALRQRKCVQDIISQISHGDTRDKLTTLAADLLLSAGHMQRMASSANTAKHLQRMARPQKKLRVSIKKEQRQRGRRCVGTC